MFCSCCPSFLSGRFGSPDQLARLQGLVAKAKWQQQMAQREAEAKKAAEDDLYRKTHCKRIRNSVTPETSAPTDSPRGVVIAATVEDSPAPESNETGEVPLSDAAQEEAPVEVCFLCKEPLPLF